MKFHYLFLVFVMTACTSRTEDTTEKTIRDTQKEIKETIKNIDKPISKLKAEVSDPDSVIVPPFAIHFDFSEKVQKILDSGKEHLIVSIMLYGPPEDKSKVIGKDYYNDYDEEIYLRNNLDIVYEQNENQTFTIENIKVSKEAFNALKNPNYTVNISFISSRSSSDNNLFDTESLIENVDKIKNKTHTVKVSML